MDQEHSTCDLRLVAKIISFLVSIFPQLEFTEKCIP
jgi:hypothetical protein